MSDEEQRAKLVRLKTVREGNCGVVTKLCREIDTVLAEESFNTDPTIVSRLNVIHEQLNGKMKQFSNLDREIVMLCPIEEIEREIEDSEAITAKIIEAKRKIQSALRERPRDYDVRLPPVAPPESPATKPRLPKLTLPRFRGEVTQWSSFWDSYKSAVHENTVAIIDNYLNSLLEGAAARTIQGLTLNEANYNSAIQLLQDRYEKPQHIISAHMEEIIKLPACSGEKLSALRYVYDKVNVNIRGLVSMGINSEQYGSLLIPIIMTKLPQNLRLRIARETDKEVWQIDELMTVIKKEVEAREATEFVKLHQPKLPVGARSPFPSTPTAAALVTSGSSVRCVYCKESHYSASCLKFRTPQEHRAILVRTGRCFNCLKTNHKCRECESPKTCRYCNRRHHQSRTQS